MDLQIFCKCRITQYLLNPFFAFLFGCSIERKSRKNGLKNREIQCNLEKYYPSGEFLCAEIESGVTG
jgi:hypothetical protein